MSRRLTPDQREGAFYTILIFLLIVLSLATVGPLETGLRVLAVVIVSSVIGWVTIKVRGDRR